MASKLKLLPLWMLLLPQLSLAASLVAIDVGHSRAKPGATSARGKPEFEFNQELAKLIAQVLGEAHQSSLLIGAEGDMLDLKRRTAEAEQAGAGFFLSIHHDSAQPKYFDKWLWQGRELGYSDQFAGFSLFVSRNNPAWQASLACASKMGAALRLAGMSPSPHHAEPIPGENREWADEANGVYFFDDLIVLKTAKSPAVLLEAGVIVNRAEERALEQPETQGKIAQAIASALPLCPIDRSISDIAQQGEK